MAILSALTRTSVDQAGNPLTESWVTLEFSGAYAEGGQFQDLSSLFRRIEHVETFAMSGGVTRAPISGSAAVQLGSGQPVIVTPVEGDYTSPVSARFLLGGYQNLSGDMGAVLDVLSGLAASVSGIRFGARIIGY
jgi:hypothetical protein